MNKLNSQIDLTDISRQLDRYQRCIKQHDTYNANDAQEQISKMLALLPTGSGLDNGVQFDNVKSTPNKLVFKFSYHHMNNGSYTKWTTHTLVLTPSFAIGYDMKITGKDLNQIKEYLYDLFSTVFFY